MQESIKNKLDNLIDRFEELSVSLASVEVINSQQVFRNLSKEYSNLEPIVHCYKQYKVSDQALNEAESLLEDPEMKEMAEEEIQTHKNNLTVLERDLQILLLPTDPNDSHNVYLEIRAGTGGDEAAIFVGDLFRMYSRFAEQNKWQIEVVSANHSEHGGYKEIISRLVGQNVYQKLKFESSRQFLQNNYIR